MNYNDIADCAGCMQSGYDPDDINRVFGTIEGAIGPGVELICVWEYFDDAGYGGQSQFYLVADGHAHDLAGDLWAWLSQEPGTSDAPAGPGDPGTWRGALTRDFADYAELGGDGWHNFALTNTEGDNAR